ncbi:MAG: hypothetical protein J7647_04985 [Cyanobacteria bacterium SBLK]|nr:hypothetical protein [Cyanobacteria bacterium SBLK]
MVSKKDDPEYGQISGFLPKELIEQFKQRCNDERITFSDGMESAFEAWLNADNFLRKLVARERPDDSQVVELAHDLGLETADLLKIVNIVIGYKNGDITDDGNNGT